MPHKRNPVAAVVILGCTKQAPGLLATLAGAAEQEHQRAAGAWHAEWQPLASPLRLGRAGAPRGGGGSGVAPRTGRSLGEVLSSPDLAARVEAAGVTSEQIGAALDPDAHLGSAA